MKLLQGCALAAVLALPVAAVHAAPCAVGTSSFTDVPDSAIYCTNAQWLKNRAITLGCTGTTFCPTDNVTRASMALFMNRLGAALTPATVYTEVLTGAFTTNSVGVEQCVSATFPVAGFPRSAAIQGSFAGTSATAMTIRAITVYSTDGGATWTPTGANFLRASAAGASWTQSTSFGALDMDVGQTYRFAVRIASDAVSQAVADSRCQLLVTIGNRNGATAPFDPAN